MRKALGVFFLSIFSVVMVVGCGGNSVTAQNPSGQVVPASLTIHDNPPAGVTVLNFEITVSGASLQPSDSSKAAVSMIQGPEEIELEHLQAESALLGNENVPAGTYNGLSVTFANPKMTVLNQTTAAMSLGSGQSCAVGQTCEFSPKLNQTMVTVQGTAPFPITLTANSPVALDLDFNVDASIQSGDLSITPSISLKQVNMTDEREKEDLHFVGRVMAIDPTNKTFTLQTGLGGQTQMIGTDTKTEFNFENRCAANNFSCLATGQVVKVEAQLPTSGTTPLAKEVELFALGHDLAVVGLVSKVDVAKNQFQLVARDVFDEGGQMQGIPSGVQVTVQIASPATFSINTNGLALPAGLNFASVSDMMVGQAVEFHPVAPFTITGTQPNLSVTVNTDKVRLEPSPVTATISATNPGGNPPSFTLGTLPMFFTAGGVSAIQVDVLSTTKFVNDSTGLAGLTSGNKVSVGGLLFKTGSTPTMVAERVFVRMP